MKFFLIALLTVISISSLAVEPILEYDCKFTKTADTKGLRYEKLNMIFTVMEDDTAMMRSNNGGAEVIFMFEGDQVTFVEFTDSGNIATTTSKVTGGATVHSRNMFMFDNFMPSQFYGNCAFTKLTP
jgi:hypothetical protein